MWVVSPEAVAVGSEKNVILFDWCRCDYACPRCGWQWRGCDICSGRGCEEWKIEREGTTAGDQANMQKRRLTPTGRGKMPLFWNLRAGGTGLLWWSVHPVAHAV